jgi:hypothetical protein
MSKFTNGTSGKGRGQVLVQPDASDKSIITPFKPPTEIG